MAFTIAVTQLTYELESGTSNYILEDGTTDLFTETAQPSTDLTAYLQHDSITLKFNTLDGSFVNPPSGALELSATVTTTDPAWSGTIGAITTYDPVDRQGNEIITVTATNTNVLPSDTAPFDLSDVPVGGLFDYLLEDASGHYMIESGTDFAPGAFLLEGTLSYGYRGLSVRQQTNATGPNTVLGRCTVVQPGLRPGNTVNLTSQNQGLGGYPFQINQASITWPVDGSNPFYLIEFGDVPQTLATFVQAVAPVAVVPVAPPVAAVIPAGPVTYGAASTGYKLWPMGGGIVTIASGNFSVSAPAGHTMTVQVQGAIDVRTHDWDNYVAAPRRGVRAILSGGIYTGAWQETPFGFIRNTYDVSSASGIALPDGTYTVSLQIDTVEYNRLEVFSGWVQCSVTVV